MVVSSKFPCRAFVWEFLSFFYLFLSFATICLPCLALICRFLSIINAHFLIPSFANDSTLASTRDCGNLIFNTPRHLILSIIHYFFYSIIVFLLFNIIYGPLLSSFFFDRLVITILFIVIVGSLDHLHHSIHRHRPSILHPLCYFFVINISSSL